MSFDQPSLAPRRKLGRHRKSRGCSTRNAECEFSAGFHRSSVAKSDHARWGQQPCQKPDREGGRWCNHAPSLTVGLLTPTVRLSQSLVLRFRLGSSINVHRSLFLLLLGLLTAITA